MRNIKRMRFVTTINIILFAVVILFHTSDIADISIGNATPLLLLPLITAFSIFNSPGKSVLAGFIAGACMDSVSGATYCFNTVCFMLIALFICLAANNLFNKNIRAAAVLSIISAGAYFVALWLTFHVFGRGVQDSLGYLLGFAFPSAVYSAVFIFPLFYLYRYFEKIRTQ